MSAVHNSLVVPVYRNAEMIDALVAAITGIANHVDGGDCGGQGRSRVTSHRRFTIMSAAPFYYYYYYCYFFS